MRQLREALALFDALCKENNVLNEKNLNLIKRVAAISVGYIGERLVLDLDYDEDAGCGIDLNVVMQPGLDIVEIQGTAERRTFSKSELIEMTTLAEKGIGMLFEMQKIMTQQISLKGWQVVISRWMIATNNEGKLLEFEKFFEGKASLESFKSIGKKSPEEPHKTFLENALEKARYASLVTSLPSIADDSGLVVDYLGGLPGVSQLDSQVFPPEKSVSKMKKI